MPQFTTYEIRINNLTRSLRAAQLISGYTGIPFARIRRELLSPPFQLPRTLPLARAVSIQRELEKCGCKVELKKIVTEMVSADEMELFEEETAETVTPAPLEITLPSASYRVIPTHRSRWWWWLLPLILLILFITWMLQPSNEKIEEEAARRHSSAQQLLLSLDVELTSPNLLPEAEQRITAARGLLLRLESLLRGVTDEAQRFLLEREYLRLQERVNNLMLLSELPRPARDWTVGELNSYQQLPTEPLFSELPRRPVDSSIEEYFDFELESFFARLRLLRMDAELDYEFLHALQRVEALLPFAGEQHAGPRLSQLLQRPEIQRQRELAVEQWRMQPQVERIVCGKQLYYVASAPGADTLHFTLELRDTLLTFNSGILALSADWRDASVSLGDTEVQVDTHPLEPAVETPRVILPEHAMALLQTLGGNHDVIRITETATVLLSTANNDSPFRNALELAWLIFNLSGREPQPMLVAANGHLALIPTDRQWRYFLSRHRGEFPFWQALFL
ncbi:MAG: hypothetical protein ISR91_07490 [Candidatus Delongbacteria bacterium]|nr:hypothetical protein [Candidatus Delongbacteria bacterium]